MTPPRRRQLRLPRGDDHPASAGSSAGGASVQAHARGVRAGTWTRSPPARARPSASPTRSHPPGRHVLLTFDDGGTSASRSETRSRSADGRGFLHRHRSHRLTHFFTAPEIRYLTAVAMSWAAHSDTHPDISGATWDRMIDEWRVSRDKLAQLLGAPCRTASVPGGDSSPLVLRSAGARVSRISSRPSRCSGPSRRENAGSWAGSMPKAWTPPRASASWRRSGGGASLCSSAAQGPGHAVRSHSCTVAMSVARPVSRPARIPEEELL